jgi:drug/metabolite transporter (DMT)-like permease
MWVKRILIAAVFNGLAALGSRTLQAWDLNEGHRFQYLALWYGVGAVAAIVPAIRARARPSLADVAAGIALGITGLVGEICILRALQDLDGSVVYSGVIAGEIALVGIIGAVAFREKLGPYGVAGIIAGVASVVLLTLG